ncbi:MULTISPECIES: hypothetical protein [unclassified Bradyrhizobium]|uniref:hypothetical protein n=1 Tax=unclassified Bradyrhizobium TaxID=2631580 RepID=UPI001BA80228|nr:MULTISPECIES: hypothetical protein [unclassified Bradyrhizobium]
MTGSRSFTPVVLWWRIGFIVATLTLWVVPQRGGKEVGGISSMIALSSTAAELQQLAEIAGYFTYFLDEVPSDGDLSPLYTEAGDVVIAKVKLQRPLAYLIGRDESGAENSRMPRDRFLAHIKLLQVLRGDAVTDRVAEVRFAVTGELRRFIYPYTPDQIEREYFVVLCLDRADGVQRLKPFAISEARYSQWWSESNAYRIFVETRKPNH